MLGLNFIPILAGSLVVGAAVVGGYAVLTTSGPFAQSDEAPAAAQSPALTTAVPSAPAAVALPEIDVRTLEMGLPSGVASIRPAGVAVDSSGNLYVADFDARRIYVRRVGGATEVVAGSGEDGIADGPAAKAQFMGPISIAVTDAGVLFVVDSPAHRIRRIDPSGTVSTFAGGGTVGLGQGEFRDGQGEDARFNLPGHIALDPAGNLVLTDKDNNRIRRISPAGLVTTIAGDGASGPGSSPVRPGGPAGLAVGKDGTIYFTAHRDNAVIRLTPTGSFERILSSVPGPVTGGKPVNGLTYFLAFPSGVAILSDGSLLVADTQANRILRVTPSLQVIQVAGGSVGNADGKGSAATFRAPVQVVALPNGDVIVVDSGNSRLRVLSGLIP